MGLGIYTSSVASSRTKDNSGSTGVHAFTVTLDGRAGGIRQYRLFVRNDDSARSFTGLTVQPIATTSPSVVDGTTTGFTWKLFAGDKQPTDAQWGTVTAAAVISLSNIGTSTVSDIASYLPFWVRVEIPRNTSVQVLRNVVLKVAATEILI